MEDTSTSTQETSISDATPAQDTTSTSSTPTSTESGKPEGATATPPEETWEYTGDRKAVPAPFQKFVAGLDRYVSKKDQVRSELDKRVKEYETFVNSETYKQYQDFVKQGQNTGSAPAPQVTQEESEAIMLGDAKTLQSVIQREVKRGLEAEISPKEAIINQRINAMDTKQRELEAAEMIKAFAEVNTDFWDLYDSGFEDYIITSVKAGKSLDAVYAAAKGVEAKMAERLDGKRKADFEKKKAGSVAGKSIAGSPDIVYADNEDHAKKLAIELTLKGDKRHVRIKPKQK